MFSGFSMSTSIFNGDLPVMIIQITIPARAPTISPTPVRPIKMAKVPLFETLLELASIIFYRIKLVNLRFCLAGTLYRLIIKYMVSIGNIQLPEFPLLLAPMEDVSDPPFRAVCKDKGADLMYTEFISSEGLIRDAIKSRKKLDIFDYERPVGIQIFGGDEEAMALSAQIVDAVNPDLLDINFGCPVKKVVSKGAGAAVLKDIDLMVRLTKAVVNSTS